MSVPWLKRLSGRAEVKYFPPTNAPVMFLLPNRAGVPIYGQPQPTVMMMPPANAVRPLPPPPPRPRPPVPPLPRFTNTDQTCVSTCPDGTTGDPIFYTVPAGTISSTVSVAAANEEAMADACAEVARLRALTPCVEAPDIEIDSEYQNKSGEAVCIVDSFASDNPPVVYNGIGTSDGCQDGNGLGTIATGQAVPVSIDLDAGTINYALSTFGFIRKTYNIACGVPYDVNIIASPANGGTATEVGSGVGGIALQRAPEFNPYTFRLAIKFDLTGTRPAATDSEQLIDVSAVTFTGCRVATENVIEDGGIPWVPADQDDALSSYQSVDGNVNVAYSVSQVRANVDGLTAGLGYRLAFIFASRDIGSADPFVPIADPAYSYFEATGPTHTSPWVNVPLIEGKEVKVNSISISEVAITSVAIAADGESVTMTFSGNASFGAGGSGGFVLTTDAGDVALTYASGAGTDTLVFTPASPILALDGDGVLTYTQPGNGLIVSAAAVATFGGYAVDNTSDAIPEPDVAWIMFDEGAGTSFAALVGSGGTLSTAAMWTAGPPGLVNAIQGNGTDRWGVTTSPLAFGSATIVTAFVRVMFNSVAGIKILFQGGADPNTAASLYLGTFNGRGYMVMTDDTDPIPTANDALFDITTGVWHNLLMVFNRELLTLTLWVDGVETAFFDFSDSMSLGTVFADEVFYFMSQGGASKFGDAKIADLRIWTGDKSEYVDLIDADV